ncbi:MAG: hypothetical protein KatS3mg131_2308 [Candidatus Tectimicrobiota bacterium]|nr:MAG: hypothetical protein KatS3mg131_2308 [Candidatus Tectomicrobia bacterium]
MDDIARVNPSVFLILTGGGALAAPGHLRAGGLCGRQVVHRGAGHQRRLAARSPGQAAARARAWPASRSASTPRIPKSTTPFAICPGPGAGAVRAARGAARRGPGLFAAHGGDRLERGRNSGHDRLGPAAGGPKCSTSSSWCAPAVAAASPTSPPPSTSSSSPTWHACRGVGRGSRLPGPKTPWEHAGGPRRRPAHSRQGARPTSAASSGSSTPASATAQELRPRLLPGGQVLLPHYPPKATSPPPLPLHAGHRRQPAHHVLCRAVAAGTGLHRAARSAAWRPLRGV